MPVKEVVTKVWIDPGCIVCDACETTCPEVFDVQEETCVIRPPALEEAFTRRLTPSIIEAAQECPVDVIKFETKAVELSDAEVAAIFSSAEDGSPTASVAAHAAAPAAESESVVAAPASPAPTAKPAAAAVAAEAPAARHSPVAPAADLGDANLQALLRAATTRGGQTGISKARGGPISGDPLRADPRELPPDARFAKTVETARKLKKDAPTRREMMSLSSVAMIGGWVAFGGATAILVGPAGLSFSMPRALEEPDPRVRVGPLKLYLDMKPGEVNEDYKPKGIWMIREDDRIAALNIICTHLGCIPNWLPNDRKFLCPCHGSGYYFTGINFQGPTPRPLERFRILVEDGIVVVDKSKKFQYELGQWTEPASFIPV